MNVGSRTLPVRDDVQGAQVPVRVLYPTEAPASTQTFGPYSVELALDAPVAGDALPLPVVALSHGTNSTPWGYTAMATYLARAGFAVVLVEHPGNSRADNSLENTPANLANRPRHIRLALDAAFAAFAAHVVPGRAAVIGHSMGGYTALAVAGGRPMSLPHESPDGVGHPVPVDPDPRVDAVVLLCPALPWLMPPGALAQVTARVFVRTGELDAMLPPAHSQRVLASLPSTTHVDSAIVPGGGHFFCWGPVPAAFARIPFPPGTDPPGFDRAACQAQLFPAIEAFLRAR